ncbi:alpha/beta-gliadin A-V-like [Belonocnema kinseyi]|uniref:alpha/beta-gliadin A-V-like n=1 Tax=Belonocnema kinseyi TaxID=2817044 RepID=UPI00143CDCAE|nr:alpha/beta-gliadin A-V-like [Belonocnema kinseyi]
MWAAILALVVFTNAIDLSSQAFGSDNMNLQPKFIRGGHVSVRSPGNYGQPGLFHYDDKTYNQKSFPYPQYPPRYQPQYQPQLQYQPQYQAQLQHQPLSPPLSQPQPRSQPQPQPQPTPQPETQPQPGQQSLSVNTFKSSGLDYHDIFDKNRREAQQADQAQLTQSGQYRSPALYSKQKKRNTLKWYTINLMLKMRHLVKKLSNLIPNPDEASIGLAQCGSEQGY